METHEGFSIREYVSRMRSANVVKCWPFDEDTGEDSVKSLLPPITVKKFTWWLDELELLHSKSSQNKKRTQRKKKKKKFLDKGESSSLRSRDDLQGMEAVKVKSKAKAPKRRSILELFAVAPQVERVITSEEEEEGIKRKKKTYKKNKEIILSKLKKAKKAISKMKMQKKMDPSIRNKENCFTSNTGVTENDIRDQVCIRKKKTRVQPLLSGSDKKMYGLPESPKGGILRDPGKAKCILQEEDVHCGSQKADKRVTFLQRSRRQQVEEHYSCGSADHEDVSDQTAAEPFSASDIGLKEAPRDSQGVGCTQANYNSRNVKDLGTCGPPMYFKDYLGGYNEPSVSNYSERIGHFPPRELLASPDGSIYEGFEGLPLNSQGGLMRLNSSKMIESEQSWEWRRDQLNLFPVQGYPKENPTVFVPSSRSDQGNSPTMRLMGKELIVGRRGLQRFEEEQMWKDKQDDLRFNNNNNNINSFGNVMMHDRQRWNEGKAASMYSYPHFDFDNSGFMTCQDSLAATGYKSQYQVFNLDHPNGNIQLQNMCHAQRSAIRFPFMYPDLEGTSNFQPHRNLDGRSHHPSVVPRTNYNPFSCPSTLQRSMGPPSNQQVPTTVNSRIAIRHLSHGRKLKRQPPLPYSSAAFLPVMVSGSEYASPIGDIGAAFESCSLANKSNISMPCDEYQRSAYPWIDSYGRIASYGASNHLLKASQQRDQTNIPFTADFRFTESDNSANIYKL